MMGKSHAATGAAGIALLGIVPFLNINTYTLAIAVLAGAGAALLPDMDHVRSTAAFTFPPFSRWLAAFIENFSAAIYLATRTGRDARREGGHRTLTHTALFCIVVGIGVLFLAKNNMANLVILFIMLCLGLRGLFPKSTNKHGKWFLYALVSLLPIAMYVHLIPMLDAIILAIVVGLGSLIHNLGDCLTNSGTPLLFPIPIKRQLWYRFRTPARFSTGSKKGTLIELWIRVLCLLIILIIFSLRIIL